MENYTIKTCPKCGQQLRFPENIGGMLMACPSCGNRFSSDFKIGAAGKSHPRNVLADIFAMPYKIFRRIVFFFTLPK
jgi:DNA-directed RNA polymerase subunit RPC12/RpoP